MRHERQLEFLQKVADAGPRMTGFHVTDSMRNPASVYTDPGRLHHEMHVLFKGRPTCFALSCEIPNAGDYRSAQVGGIPIVVIRQDDGSLRAMTNVCRHRGSPLVEKTGFGSGLKVLSCPYHSWTFEVDGSLRGRPGSQGAFDDLLGDFSLGHVSVSEHVGLIFVQVAGPREESLQSDAAVVDLEVCLGAAQDDLEAFGLAGYTHIESRTSTWNMNWKLVIDTFTESYHIRSLHRDSIAPHYLSYSVASESLGDHTLSLGLRRSILEEMKKPKTDWSLLPHATIQYLLMPNVVLTHQQHHVEMWRVEPMSTNKSVLTTSVYAPTKPHSERSHQFFVKNLDLLLGVTNTEDFPLMERIQANLESGALPELVYGRNEGPLIRFHQSINRLLAGTPPSKNPNEAIRPKRIP